jgi:hypothetical protein
MRDPEDILGIFSCVTWGGVSNSEFADEGERAKRLFEFLSLKESSQKTKAPSPFVALKPSNERRRPAIGWKKYFYNVGAHGGPRGLLPRVRA